MEETKNEDSDIVRLNVGLSCDDSGFFRRQCPGCDLPFKEEADSTSLQDLLSRPVSRALPEDPTEPAAQRARTTCPYCGHEGDHQDFLPSDTVAHLKRIALRELVEPQLSELFSGFERALGGGKGLFSVTVTTNFQKSPRPLPGIEPDDQVIVRCLHCSKRFKVCEHWRGIVRCSSCGDQLLPQ